MSSINRNSERALGPEGQLYVGEGALFPVTVDDEDHVMLVEQWRDVEVEVTLDSGCCNHVLDSEDAPGYLVQESPGSRRGQSFVVGSGERVPNKGQVHLNLEAHVSNGRPLSAQSTFEVAEVSRPLMSVSRICEQGHSCLFTSEGAKVIDSSGKELYSFKNSNGLYVANMKLKPPEPFRRQAP